jgi:hypothetical protein
MILVTLMQIKELQKVRKGTDSGHRHAAHGYRRLKER